jgi:hypothetical protein
MKYRCILLKKKVCTYTNNYGNVIFFKVCTYMTNYGKKEI